MREVLTHSSQRKLTFEWVLGLRKTNKSCDAIYRLALHVVGAILFLLLPKAHHGWKQGAICWLTRYLFHVCVWGHHRVVTANINVLSLKEGPWKKCILDHEVHFKRFPAASWQWTDGRISIIADAAKKRRRGMNEGRAPLEAILQNAESSLSANVFHKLGCLHFKENFGLL